MTIEELIKSGEWGEKIITPNGEIKQDDPTFVESKQKFLAGDKTTNKWILSAYKL